MFHKRLCFVGVIIFALGLLVPLASHAEEPPGFLLAWGSYGSGDGEFNSPYGVAVDGSGNVYVADGNNRIQKFTGDGVFLTKWGTEGSGDGQFNSPESIAIDAFGNVFVADTFNGRIQKFTNDGVFLTKWHIGVPCNLSDVSVDASGNVYVVACGNNSLILVFTSVGQLLTQWGSYGTGDGEFSVGPWETAVDADGNVYVTDNGNNRIQKFTSDGVFLTKWGSYGSGDGAFNQPSGIAVDASSNVYVTDWDNHRIQKFTSDGVFLTKWGSYGSGDGEFHFPYGVAVDGSGNVYVTDWDNHRIQKFGPATISMVFDFAPNTLNLASQGLWVTGFLEPIAPYVASDIDITSIKLNGTVAVDPAAPTAIGDHDANGVPDLMVKFNRAEVELTVSEGDNVPVTVTGTLAGHSFSGTDSIRVRRAVVSAPLAGSHLTAGSVTTVNWQTPSSVTVQSVALLHSLDNGSTWGLIARGLPNTGSYDWTVPNVQTDQAKVAVVLVESSDETGYIVDGVLGVSETFSIDAPVGVGDNPVTFALSVVNPSMAQLVVSFALPTEVPAQLELLDVTGRQLVSRDVGSLGAGRHTVNLMEGRRLSAGLYLVRLTQGFMHTAKRVVVIR